MPSSEPTTIVPMPLSLLDEHVRYARVRKRGDEPPAQPGMVDVAVLDMNHGYPNLGHASIVETLLNIGHLERLEIGPTAPDFRVISFDVRGGGAVPISSPGRFPVIVGTGGPGSLDPRENDGISELSQGILEDPSWETPLWHFFDAILAARQTSFFGICHSFGLMARWSGIAESVLRPASKGGKSSGVVTNLLTGAARKHPWFSQFYEASNGPAIEVLDSRLFDLMPAGKRNVEMLAFEATPEGDPGAAVTMVEFARQPDGVLPRVWGVNHHPEIGDKGLQRERLERIESWGKVTPEWLHERRAALAAWNASALTERHLQWTSSFTFVGPIEDLIGRALAELGER
jgi:hypothetical protein